MSKTMTIGSILLAGAAAYGIYRIMQLSEEERSDLMDKGKKLVTDNLGNLKNVFGGQQGSTPVPATNGESVMLGS